MRNITEESGTCLVNGVAEQRFQMTPIVLWIDQHARIMLIYSTISIDIQSTWQQRGASVQIAMTTMEPNRKQMVERDYHKQSVSKFNINSKY